MQATERLYYTADRLRLVPEGDPGAATLAYAVGDELSERHAQQLAALAKESKAEPAEDETKALPKPADKARRPAANK